MNKSIIKRRTDKLLNSLWANESESVSFGITTGRNKELKERAEASSFVVLELKRRSDETKKKMKELDEKKKVLKRQVEELESAESFLREKIHEIVYDEVGATTLKSDLGAKVLPILSVSYEVENVEQLPVPFWKKSADRKLISKKISELEKILKMSDEKSIFEHIETEMPSIIREQIPGIKLNFKRNIRLS